MGNVGTDGDQVWSTYLGGDPTNGGWDIEAGPFDSVYVTGDSASVVKISNDGRQLWSQSLSGEGRGLDVDSHGSVYVTGIDNFVTKLGNDGQTIWTLQFGGSDADLGFGIAVDPNSSIYVTGLTHSTGWTSGGYDTSHNGERDGFILRIDELIPEDGDVDMDGDIDADDIDALYNNFFMEPPADSADLNHDSNVDNDDARILIQDILGTDFGDANLSQTIDLIDFGHLAGGFGGDDGWANGNFDGFLGVNVRDFGLLAGNYGKDLTTGQSPVPEPAGLAVLVVGSLLGVRRPRLSQ